MTSNTSGVERRKRKTQAMTGGQPKNPRFEEDVVDPSVCCMCFGTYEEDILGAGRTGYLVLVAGGCMKTVQRSAALTGWTRVFLSCLRLVVVCSFKVALC